MVPTVLEMKPTCPLNRPVKTATVQMDWGQSSMPETWPLMIGQELARTVTDETAMATMRMDRRKADFMGPPLKPRMKEEL
jgi:hypothetical protein